jgi:folylpolyglutamate synthase
MPMVILKEVCRFPLAWFTKVIEMILDLTSLAIPTDDLAQLKTQRQFASAWSSLFPSFPSSNVHVLPSIEHAIKEIEKIDSTSSESTKVLVTGSLHLVGGVVEVAGLSAVALSF